MCEVMQVGVYYVGGLDLISVDGVMEKFFDIMFQIVLDYDKGVDIYLYEIILVGVAVINYMVEMVEKMLQLKGKLIISYVFVLVMFNE